VAIDHPGLQETIIGVFYECLYFGDQMEDLLINPNQLCANRLIVDTCPKQFSIGKSLHGIYNAKEDFFYLSRCMDASVIFHCVCQPWRSLLPVITLFLPPSSHGTLTPKVLPAGTSIPNHGRGEQLWQIFLGKEG